MRARPKRWCGALWLVLALAGCPDDSSGTAGADGQSGGIDGAAVDAGRDGSVQVGDAADATPRPDALDPADAPDAVDVPDPGDVLGVGDAPDAVDVPDELDLPAPVDGTGGDDTTDAVDVADGADVSDVVDVPDSADLPDAADGADPADVPDAGDAGDVPDPGDVPDIPDAADVPDPECLAAPELCDDSNACTMDGCDPLSGCTHVPIVCDDSSACTTDGCDTATGCTHGTVDCDDSDACTTDGCDLGLGCTHDTVDCDDTNACTSDGCDTATGCTHDPVDCDDSDACTTDGCDTATGCTHGTVDCDDTNACTADGCDTATGCTHGTVDCDDSDVCTADGCDLGSGCTHDTVACDDGIACTTETCDPATGCASTSACATGYDCSSINELCHSCDDTHIGFEDDSFPSPAGGDWTSNGYTSVTALPLEWDGVSFSVSDDSLVRAFHGNTEDPNDYRFLGFSGLDSRDVWITFPYPIKHLTFDVRQYMNWYNAAVAYEIVVDGTGVHTFQQATSNTSPVRVEVTFPGEASFVVIRKIAGTSQSGFGVDNIVYTGATCGCVPGGCDDGDGDACVGEYCDTASGDCVSDGTLDCDDGALCTLDTCAPATGCVHAPASCDDGNPCTTASCHPLSGCQYSPAALGSACDDGNPCTTASQCAAPQRSADSCDDLQWNEAADRGSPLVCGESDPAGNDVCSGPVTYDQAVTFCTTAGGRLCTASELAADETRGTGCGYDAQSVWSATPCDDGHWAGPGRRSYVGTDGQPRIPYLCTSDDAVRVVRCCADTSPADTTPICEATAGSCGDGTCTTGACYLDSGCVDAAVDASCGTRVDDTLGCPGSSQCEGCVCHEDSTCCSVGWDADCAACAAGTGSGANGVCQDMVCADVCGAGQTACGPGDPCEAAGVCLDGACFAGDACDDGNPCTTDGCTAGGCTHDTEDCNDDACVIAACEPTCDVGGSVVGTGCFQVMQVFNDTRAHSQATCAQAGGTLASIDSKALNDQLRSIADSVCGSTAAWIGLSDSDREGLYKWTDGAIATFTNWNPGQPVNNASGVGQDFVRMLPNGYWVDTVNNTATQCAICEFPATQGCSTGWSNSTCCPNAGASGPGCDDAACQACVCAQDSYCCDTNWDGNCADCSAGGPGNANACLDSGCEYVCGCTATYASVSQDCCAGGTGPGCGNALCEQCVCEMDSHCCANSWDESCGDCAKGTGGACGGTCVDVCACDETSCFE